MFFPPEKSVAVPVAVSRTRERKEYVPAALPVELNVTLLDVIPVMKFTNLPPGAFIWTSYTRVPVAFAEATVIVNIVPAGPDGGEAITGTVIVPVIPRLWWKVQW